MWYLVGIENKEVSSLLLCNRAYKIGRLIKSDPDKNPDLALDGDSSVSRLHAEILVKFTEAKCVDIDTRPNIILTDHSRFGTFVNDSKINEFKTLNKNDKIRFGMNNSIFKLCNDTLMITTSCLNNANKNIVKKLICQLGGHMTNEWHPECSFIVMDRLTITVKVTNALINQKYIVTKKYFEDLVKYSADLKTNRPDPSKYLPPLSEEENLEDVCFMPNIKRQNLFESKIFIFFNEKQKEKMQCLIESAAGQCGLFNITKHLTQRFLKTNTDLLFVNPDEITDENSLNKLIDLLNNLDRRTIDDTEVGLAILYASTAEHCNLFMKNTDKKINEHAGFKVTQSLGESVFDDFNKESINTETQYNDLVLAAFETQDSAPFEFERNKINETVKITNTPERKQRSRYYEFEEEPKSIEKNSRIVEIVIPETPEKENCDDIVITNEPEIKNIVTEDLNIKKRSRLNEIDEDDSDSELKKFNKKSSISPFNKKTKTLNTQSFSNRIYELAINKTSLQNNENENLFVDFISQKDSQKSKKVSKEKKKVKSEPMVIYKEDKVDVPVIPTVTYTKTQGLVYSKKNHQNCIKSDSLDASSQLKIKFEPLIKKIYNSNDDDSHWISDNGKKNFKKFRKIPKASQIQKDNGLFKNLKNEPFDLNSQFDSFINSVG